MWIVPIISTLAQLVSRQHSDLQGVSANQHHAQSHSIGDHTNVTRYLSIPMLVYAGTGVWDLTPGMPSVSLRDGNTESVYLVHQIPSDYVGDLTHKLVFFVSSANPDVRIGFEFRLLREGLDPASDIVTIAASTRTIVGNNLIEEMTMSPGVFLFTPTKGDYISLTVTRYGGHVDDTIGDNFYVMGWKMGYTAEQ